MISRVLILGGYGNFGRYITQALAKEGNLKVIVGGRNPEQAHGLIDNMFFANPIEVVAVDIFQNLEKVLQQIKPDIVIHTCGPFQGQGYDVANSCITRGCHYIDLADAREFVSNISGLDEKAKEGGVLVISGASSVPVLTGAVMDEYLHEFEQLSKVDSAIAGAQPKEQGLATIKAILNYVGKPFATLWGGEKSDVIGWQGLRCRKFWGLNYRLLGYCDVPDLDLLPIRYPSLESVRFQAGIESRFQQLGLYLLSWLVRFKIIQSLSPFAGLLLGISKRISWFCVGDSGYFLEMSGLGKNGGHHTVTYEIVAKSGAGLNIPCIPSIILAKKLAQGLLTNAGAQTAIGIVSLDEYQRYLQDLQIAYRTLRSRD